MNLLIQNKLNKEIKAAKRAYKEKVERLFNNGKARDAWRGVKTLAGLSNPSMTAPHAEACVNMAEDLNNFFCRFDQCDYTEEREELIAELSNLSQSTAYLQLQPEEVEQTLKMLKANKAPGPDRICGRLLKACSSQLAGVLCSLFNRSLAEHSIPSVWKSSIICPVEKRSNPTNNNDYRPVALTSLVMKSFEKLVLNQLQADVSGFTDPLQFAYRRHRGVDDAVLTLLHGTITHLEKPKSLVRLVFVDFSSAFNTLQPHLMGRKLLQMDIDPHLILWVLSFLTNRPQRVRVNGHLSAPRTISTGSPQGSVISPLLFTLYTDNCRSSTPGITYIKYSDDTVIMDTTNTDGLLQKELDSFALWCRDNCLDLNTSKTKEMVIDFRHRYLTPTLSVNTETIERVESYKYLGTIMDYKLTFQLHSEHLVSKCHQRLFFLRKLRKLQVHQTILSAFYKCFIESILTFNITAWFGSLSITHRNSLNKIVKLSNKIIGQEQEPLINIYNTQVKKKGSQIATDTTHTLHGNYTLLPSARRYRSLPLRTKRALSSFIPTSIRLLNT